MQLDTKNAKFLFLSISFQRQKAHSLYENKIGELMHNEKQAQVAIETEQQNEADLQLHKVRTLGD